MTRLPWVRMEASWPSHDKILLLVERKQWQAVTAWNASIAWAGANGTDGHIPRRALPFIHATTRVAQQLVDVRLWDALPDGLDGWIIHNFDLRQAESIAAVVDFEARREAGRKAGIASGESRRRKRAGATSGEPP